MIQFCRNTEEGREIDRALNDFGLETEAQIIERAARIRRTPSPVEMENLRSDARRVIVFSRVTLGADVAVTSVIIERMKREFPRAEIVMVGGRKAAELFGGDERLSFRDIAYERAGALTERILSWLDLLAATRELTSGLRVNEYLFVDPDSRLTQLGLLPVSPSENRDYLFFPSREYASETRASMGELTSAWLDDVFEVKEKTLPRVTLRKPDCEIAEAVAASIKREKARKIVSINFGVGENPLKSLGGQLEKSLVRALVEEGAVVILDKGAGDTEARRADEVISHVRAVKSARVIEAGEDELINLARKNAASIDMLVLNGRVGLLAALIGISDLYIGYDSAGQHIAAAMGVPCIDLFAGFSSARFLDRWRPTGPGPVRVIEADTLRAQIDSEAILARALSFARETLCLEPQTGRG